MRAGLIIVPLLLFGLQRPAPAQVVPAGGTQGQESAGEWAPPAPDEDGFDWIQLKSGEWLKGRLKALQDEELEFDSDELDRQTFDWEDVIQVRSPRTQDLLFKGRETATGPIWITAGSVIVGLEQPRTFSREVLLGITPGGSRINHWSGDITLSLTTRSGNSSETVYTANAALLRRTPATRLSLDYDGYVSVIEGSDTANSRRLTAEFDYWLSDRLYLVAPYAEAFADPFQNIDLRLTLGVGMGYEIVDTSDLDWSLIGAPAYQVTRFDSSLPGEEDHQESTAFVFISETEWEITERTDFGFEYAGQLTERDSGGLHSHATASFEVDLTRRLDLDISFVWDRVSDPQEGSGGSIPEKDDYRLVVGLGVEF